MPRVSQNKLKARKALKQAEPARCFWVCDGAVLKDLKDLAGALDKMALKAFQHHVNKAKNDFAKWLKDVLDEPVLAQSIVKSRTAKAMAKKIKPYL